MTTLILSWPPSVNDYWEGMGRRRHIGTRGKVFREEVFWVVRRARMNGAYGKDARIGVRVIAREPKQKRRRDLDNLLKATLDAMKHAAVYVDDSQIDHLEVDRVPFAEHGIVAGLLDVAVYELPAPPA